MIIVDGNNISLLAGETLPITVSVQDSIGAPAENISVAKFAYRKKSAFRRETAATTTIKDCTIVGSQVSVELTQAETLAMIGDYAFEFRVKALDDVDSLICGQICVRTGLISIAI